MLHLAFRANRENFLAAQRELEKRGIEFEFQDHEISHSIYFRDPDGHALEITTYELHKVRDERGATLRHAAAAVLVFFPAAAGAWFVAADLRY